MIVGLVLLTMLLPRVLLAQNCATGPTDRTNFSPVLINDQIYIVGGSLTSLDVYSLDLSQGLDISCPSWSKPSNVQTNNQYQPFMYGVAYKGSDNNIYAQAGDGDSDEMTKIVKYNTSGSWLTPAEYGAAPSARAAMSATVDDQGTAYYYGGRSRQTSSSTTYVRYSFIWEPFNDYYFFNTSSSSWTWPSVTFGWGKPPARFDHSATLINNRLFIMGGSAAYDSSMTLYADFRSILVFDTVENKAVSMATIGDIPPARYLFSATPAPDGKSIVVFGGHNVSSGEFDPSQDVYVLDTCTLSWSKPDVSGNPPAARAGHSAITYGNYMLVMLGYSGINKTGDTLVPIYVNDVGILDMQAWKWVGSISHQDNPTAYQSANPGCQFTFPDFPDPAANEGDDPMPYDPTVISNPNAGKIGTSSKTKGLAIGFSIFALLLIAGGAFYLYRRRQRQKNRVLNPRWLPGALGANHTNNNDYPLFVYQPPNPSEKVATTATTNNNEPSVGMRSYTASDHEAWERALGQDSERPEDGRAMSRHMDIWKRMRDLRDMQEDVSKKDQAVGKLIDT